MNYRVALVAVLYGLFFLQSIVQAQNPADSLLAEAEVAIKDENYLSAIDILLSAEREIAKSENSNQNLGHLYLQLGICYEYYYHFGLSKNYYSKALKEFKSYNNKEGIAYYYTYMGDMLEDEGENEEAMKYQLISFDIFKNLDHTKGKAMVYDNMSSIYENYGKYDSSLVCLSKALELYKAAKDSTGMSVVLNNFGDIYKKTNATDKSLEAYRQSLAIAKKIGNKEEVRGNLKDMSKIYADQQKFKEAYYTFRDFFDLNQKIKIEKKIEELSTLQIKNIEENNNLERQAILNDKKIEELNFTISIIILVAIIIILIFIYVSYQYRTKKKLEIEATKKKSIETELEMRKQKLLDYTRLLAERNEKIEELTKELDVTLEKNKIDEKSRHKAIQHLTNASILTDDDWKNFKKQFESVYEGFFAKLKVQYPDFSTGDIRLAAILKLKLTQDEIAHMMGISPDSVKKAKSRLKKRIPLSDEDKLKDWVEAL